MQIPLCILSLLPLIVNEKEGMLMAKKPAKFRPWETALKTDTGEKAYIKTGLSLFLAPAFQKLSPGAQALYDRMRMESRGKRMFTFTRKTFEKYGIPERSGRRYVEELEAARFIRCDHAKYTRAANVYEFTDEWKPAPPPILSATPAPERDVLAEYMPKKKGQ